MTQLSARLTVQTFACAFLLTGCPVWGPADDTELVGACIDDFDCPIGTYCDGFTGECYESELCVSHGDCPSGSYCEFQSGLCLIPQPANCRVDEECAQGFECDFRNSCRPIGSTCRDTTDCGTGELCIEDDCQAVEETCQFDSQCPTGHVCMNNACTFTCPTDATCPEGTQCDDGLCLPSDNECLDSSDCPDLATNCVEGRCLRRCDAGCNDVTQQCSADGFCRTRSAPDPVSEAPFCSTDEECADGPHVCIEGVCRTQCDTEAPDPDAMCMSFDVQIPVCGGEGLCERDSDCRTQSECGPGVNCLDGLCS